MFDGAVARRAVALIAAVLLLVVPVRAQNQADAVVEKFAGSTETTKQKAEAARKTAEDAKAKKQAERKAAHARRVLKIRQEAEAQRAAALARIKAEKSSAPEETTAAPAPPEVGEADVTEEIRRLIQEAEAARLRAEEALAQAAGEARETPAQTVSMDDAQQAQHRREQQEAARAAADNEARLAFLRTVEARRQIKRLVRVRQIREARLAANHLAQRLAQEEAQRQRLAQEVAAAERAKVAEAAERTARQLAQEEAERRRLAREAAIAERAKAADAARLAAQQQAERQAQEAALRQRLAEEADALERARAADAAKLAAHRQSERQTREEALRQRLAEEADALERAKAADAARLAAQQQAERQAQEAALRQHLAQEVADRARAEEVRDALEASRKEAERKAAADLESRRLAEAQPRTAPAPHASEPPASAPFPGRSGLGGAPDRRVTVLMIMAPGRYGIRRGASIADPVLCAIDGCYVSTGTDRPAVLMPRRRALGMGNTLGRRAGACRQSLGCVFRGVTLDFPGALQPVDLHILKHDRRRPQMISGDSDCRLVGGRLTCSRGIYAEDYVLWIVPEWLATATGPDVLERAVREGLPASRSTEVIPLPRR